MFLGDQTTVVTKPAQKFESFRSPVLLSASWTSIWRLCAACWHSSLCQLFVPVWKELWQMLVEFMCFCDLGWFHFGGVVELIFLSLTTILTLWSEKQSLWSGNLSDTIFILVCALTEYEQQVISSSLQTCHIPDIQLCLLCYVFTNNTPHSSEAEVSKEQPVKLRECVDMYISSTKHKANSSVYFKKRSSTILTLVCSFVGLFSWQATKHSIEQDKRKKIPRTPPSLFGTAKKLVHGSWWENKLRKTAWRDSGRPQLTSNKHVAKSGKHTAPVHFEKSQYFSHRISKHKLCVIECFVTRGIW